MRMDDSNIHLQASVFKPRKRPRSRSLPDVALSRPASADLMDQQSVDARTADASVRDDTMPDDTVVHIPQADDNAARKNVYAFETLEHQLQYMPSDHFLKHKATDSYVSPQLVFQAVTPESILPERAKHVPAPDQIVPMDHVIDVLGFHLVSWQIIHNVSARLAHKELRARNGHL